MSSQEVLKTKLFLLMRKDENSVCCDCSEPNATWASIIVPPPGSHEKCRPLGAFCCMLCSGAHRRLGTHISFVRSVELDTWKETEVQAMKIGGNKKVNKAYESSDTATNEKPTQYSDIDERLEFIRNKYEYRKFYNVKKFEKYSLPKSERIEKEKKLKKKKKDKKNKEKEKKSSRKENVIQEQRDDESVSSSSDEDDDVEENNLDKKTILDTSPISQKEDCHMDSKGISDEETDNPDAEQKQKAEMQKKNKPDKINEQPKQRQQQTLDNKQQRQKLKEVPQQEHVESNEIALPELKRCQALDLKVPHQQHDVTNEISLPELKRCQALEIKPVTNKIRSGSFTNVTIKKPMRKVSRTQSASVSDSAKIQKAREKSGNTHVSNSSTTREVKRTRIPVKRTKSANASASASAGTDTGGSASSTKREVTRSRTIAPSGTKSFSEKIDIRTKRTVTRTKSAGANAQGNHANRQRNSQLVDKAVENQIRKFITKSISKERTQNEFCDYGADIAVGDDHQSRTNNITGHTSALSSTSQANKSNLRRSATDIKRDNYRRSSERRLSPRTSSTSPRRTPDITKSFDNKKDTYKRNVPQRSRSCTNNLSPKRNSVINQSNETKRDSYKRNLVRRSSSRKRSVSPQKATRQKSCDTKRGVRRSSSRKHSQSPPTHNVTSNDNDTTANSSVKTSLDLVRKRMAEQSQGKKSQFHGSRPPRVIPGAGAAKGDDIFGVEDLVTSGESNRSKNRDENKRRNLHRMHNSFRTSERNNDQSRGKKNETQGKNKRTAISGRSMRAGINQGLRRVTSDSDISNASSNHDPKPDQRGKQELSKALKSMKRSASHRDRKLVNSFHLSMGNFYYNRSDSDDDSLDEKVRNNKLEKYEDGISNIDSDGIAKNISNFALDDISIDLEPEEDCVGCTIDSDFNGSYTFNDDGSANDDPWNELNEIINDVEKDNGAKEEQKRSHSFDNRNRDKTISKRLNDSYSKLSQKRRQHRLKSRGDNNASAYW